MGFVNQLGSEKYPWTKKQIDNFMDEMEKEMFNRGDRYRGTEGDIVALTRENSDGEETSFFKHDGEWIEGPK